MSLYGNTDSVTGRVTHSRHLCGNTHLMETMATPSSSHRVGQVCLPHGSITSPTPGPTQVPCDAESSQVAAWSPVPWGSTKRAAAD